MPNHSVDVARRTRIRNDLSRISQNHRMSGNVEIHIGPRPDQGVISDENSPYYNRMGSNPDAISDDRNARFAASISLSDGYTMAMLTLSPMTALGWITTPPKCPR